MKTVAKLTADRLRQLLHYDPKTGEWRWHHCTGYNKSFRDGTIAGSIRSAKNLTVYVIQIDRKSYNAATLAWLYWSGHWPRGYIDHIDCNPLNNKLENLRDASYSQNNANRRSPKNRKQSLPKGVSEVTDRSLQKRFMAQIKVNKKSLYLGMFETPKDAHLAYCAAAKLYFGEFARFK